MAKLKPCPFCGGKAELCTDLSRCFNDLLVFVRCSDCKSRSRQFIVESENEDEVAFEAINAWNRRVDNG